jgi:hypothetical protein
MYLLNLVFILLFSLMGPTQSGPYRTCPGCPDVRSATDLDNVQSNSIIRDGKPLDRDTLSHLLEFSNFFSKQIK